MKNILFLLLCAGCASTAPVEPKLEAPVCPKPVVVAPCSDQLKLLNEEDLAKGFVCPDNSRTTFPSSYVGSGKVLVLCQCK